MKNQIKWVYFYFLLGIIVSFIILINGGVSIYGHLGNSKEFSVTIVITSMLTFIATCIILYLYFDEAKKRFSVWFILLLSLPLTGIGVNFLIQKSIYSVRLVSHHDSISNTDLEFYYQSKTQINALDDSKRFEINNTGNNEGVLRIEKLFVDTLFYSPNGSDKIAGIQINKVYYDSTYFYQNYDSTAYIPEFWEGTKNLIKNGRYCGTSFLFEAHSEYITYASIYDVYETIEECVERTREHYLTNENKELNINSLIFWDRQDETGFEKFNTLLY